MKVKERYYYHREAGKSRHPRVFVYLLKIGEEVARGIAVCSLSEPAISLARGKAKAYGRAIKAFVRKKKDMPIVRREAVRTLLTVGVPHFYLADFRYKSNYMPKLTEFEERLLNDGAA